MARDLKLQVVLDAVDRVTRPLKKVTEGSGRTAEALKASREQLKTLERAQKDLRGFRQLKEQSQKTTRALDEQQQEIADLSRQMNRAEGDTTALARKRDQAIRQARRLKDRYDDEQRKLHGLRNTMTRVEGVTGSYSDQQRELTRRIQQANDQLQAQQQELSETARRQRAAADAAKRYQRTASRASSMAGSGAAGAAAGGAALTAMTHQALGNQISGARLAAQFGEGGQQSDGYREVITEVYRGGRGQDRAQVEQAVGAVSAAFGSLDEISGEQLAAITDKALTLSDVFGVDVAESVQTANIMVENGLARNATAAFDLIGRSFQEVPERMREELPEILHEYSTNFRALGFDGQEAMGLLVGAAEQGKFALDKTGDALKEFTIRGSDMSKASREAYEAVGLDAQAMSDAIAGGGDDAREAMHTTARAILDIEDPAKRANTAIALFGTPLEDLSVDQIPKFLEALTGAQGGLGDVTGAVDDMATTLDDNAGKALQRVQRVLAGEFMGVLDEVDDEIISVARSVTEWIDKNPELAATLTKVAAGLAALVAVGGSFLLVAGSILGPIAMAKWGLEMFGIKAGGAEGKLGKLAKNGIGALGKALGWIGRVIVSVGRLFLFNPIGIAISLLAGAAYLIYKNWEPISQFFKDRWADIKAAFSDGVGAVFRLLLNWNPIGLIYRGITAGLEALGIDVPENFKTLGGAIVDGLIGGIGDALGGLGDAIKGMGRSAMEWFKETLGINSPSRVFAEFGGFLIEGLVNGIDEKWQALKDAIGNTADAVVGWFKEKLGIHSPSRVFAELGGHTMDGYQQGLQRREAGPLRQVSAFGDRLRRAGAGMAIGAASLPAIADVPIDHRPPLQAAGGGGDVHITIEGGINVHAAPGMDEQALARLVEAQVRQALADASRDAAARRRSSFYDID